MLVIGSSRNQRIIIYHWQCYTEADPGEMTFDLSYWEVKEIEILKKWELKVLNKDLSITSNL